MPENNIQFDNYQQQVINISDGQHLVLAAPGCGKTAILAERVKKALQNGVNPNDMLCLTFTNRAARNMRTRVASQNTEDIYIGNVHRFCSRLLFDNGIVPQTTSIIDDEDAMSIILELRDKAEKREILTYEQSSTYYGYIRLQHLMKQYRNCVDKNLLLDPDAVNIFALRALCNTLDLDFSRQNILRIYDCINSREDIDLLLKGHSFAYTDLLDQMLYAKKFDQYKTEHDLIDFDDILIIAYDHLYNSTEHHRYKWIQIDEVQDLNPLQLAIIDLLSDNDCCTIYLGDEQQSIFSFIGAKPSTLQTLRSRCEQNIHTLQRNYRSPRYLLDVYNTYAINTLGVPGNVLPQPSGNETAQLGDLILAHSYSNISSMAATVRIIPETIKTGKTAIIVPTNRDADDFSTLCEHIPHFKISGTDYFSTDEVQLAINHLNVIACDTNFMAWAKIFKTTRAAKTLTSARKSALLLKDAAITPSDFILREDSSYVIDFMKTYRNCTTVIFDTETTGLDIYEDDIVQLAAIKIKDGKVIDTFNVIMATDRQIPPMLGDIPNPLIAEYAAADLKSHDEGLTNFLKFAENCVIIGHNIEFDYNILDFNLRRYCNVEPIQNLHPEYYDTLKLARLLLPDKRNYKLKSLLEELHLEGENSHLADDDIIATKSLADYLLALILTKDFQTKHSQMLNRTAGFRKIFRDLYGKLYIDALQNLHHRGKPYPLAAEFINIKDWFTEHDGSELLSKKYDYIISFITQKCDECPDISQCSSLFEQNTALNSDLNTYRESDLCDTDIISENLFISTVHKAKGLEFDNVFVFGVVDGTYPHFKSEKEEDRLEDARKLYVALSRAKHRLTILTYDHYEVATSQGTRTYKKETSPFIRPILPYFTTQNYYYPNQPYSALPPDDESRAEEAQSPYYRDRGI